MTARRRTLAALLFLLALTVLFFRQLTLSHQYTWLENPDQALQVRPWLDYEARELHAGRIPLWDPYLVCGQSLIAQVQPGLVNPLNWILFAMPLRGGHIPLETLHWYWVLIHYVAAVFAYLLCRELGASQGAAIFGASVFAFAGFIGHSATPQFLMGGLWIPAILLFFARVLRGERPRRNAALCGLAMGLAFLSGHHNIPIYTGVVMGGLWLWQVVRTRRVSHGLIFGTVCFLIASLQLFPAVEYGRLALRWSGTPEPQRWNQKIPYRVHAEYSLGASGIAGLALPNRGRHANPFVGMVAMVLATAGILRRWRWPAVWLATSVALGGMLLALGSLTPVHRLAYLLIPMVEKARYPAMAVVIAQAGIAALAALGLDSMLRARRGLAWTIGLHAVALALFFLEVSRVPLPIQPRSLPGSLVKQGDDMADIAEFFHRQPGWFRVRIDEDAAPFNFGDFYSIEEFGGYVASMPVSINASMGLAEAPRWFGLQFYIGRKPLHDDQTEVFTSRSGLKVYRYPGFEEPLWTEHDTPCAGADRLSVIRRVPGFLAIDADLACAARLVVGDPRAPGWRALVDGKRIPIQEYLGVLRALPVDSGHHRIEFRYRPGSVFWGVGLSTLGLLAAVVFYRADRLQGA